MNARHSIKGQLVLLVRITLGQPFKAVVKADDGAANVDRFSGHGSDDAVDAWRGAAAYDNADLLNCHNQFSVASGQWPVISAPW